MKTIAELYEKANGWNPAGFDRTVGELKRFAELVRADEREACAQLCEEEICHCCWDEEAGAVAEHLAATIRARGNT